MVLLTRERFSRVESQRTLTLLRALVSSYKGRLIPSSHANKTKFADSIHIYIRICIMHTYLVNLLSFARIKKVENAAFGVGWEHPPTPASPRAVNLVGSIITEKNQPSTQSFFLESPSLFPCGKLKTRGESWLRGVVLLQDARLKGLGSPNAS